MSSNVVQKKVKTVFTYDGKDFDQPSDLVGYLCGEWAFKAGITGGSTIDTDRVREATRDIYPVMLSVVKALLESADDTAIATVEPHTANAPKKKRVRRSRAEIAALAAAPKDHPEFSAVVQAVAVPAIDNNWPPTAPPIITPTADIVQDPSPAKEVDVLFSQGPVAVASVTSDGGIVHVIPYAPANARPEAPRTTMFAPPPAGFTPQLPQAKSSFAVVDDSSPL